MGFGTGRAQRLAAVVFGTTLCSLGTLHVASAQDSEEVILDPELMDSAPSRPTGPSTTAAGEDEDDHGWGEVYHEGTQGPSQLSLSVKSATADDDYDPTANTGLARLEMLGQIAADIRQEGDLEDAFETRLRFGGEVEFRRSRNLRLMLGSRLDFFWGVPGPNDRALREAGHRALDEDRFEVDVFATAAYVDATLGDGIHLRVGQQVVSLGRMDMYSPTDMLAVFDMRPQPRLDLAANKLAQPAVRLDWDLNSWATVQAVYVPWFMPHLSRSNRDQYVARVMTGGGGQVPESVRTLIDPSHQTKMGESGMRFVGPAPDFKTPQAQLRANFRGNAMEFGLSAGTALEKLPSIYYTPNVNAAMLGLDPRLVKGTRPYEDADSKLSGAQAELGTALYGGQPVVDVAYHRYNLIGIDGSFDLAPFSIGFEFAFSPSRHLVAATTNEKNRRLPLPNVTEEITDPIEPVVENGPWTPSNVTNKNIRKGVPVVQGALHLEWLKGETFALVSELFWMNALALPHDSSRDWLGFRPGSGAFVGGMLAMSYVINDGLVRFDLTTVTMVGPSLIVIPHVEVKARDGLYIDAGAQIFEGPNPGFNGMQHMNIGGMMSGYDQVFVGLRWLP